MESWYGYFEFKSDKSDKFWLVWPVGDSQTFTTAWGKIGRKPQGKKDGINPYLAHTKMEEKVKKGYVKKSVGKDWIVNLLSDNPITSKSEGIGFDFMAELKNI